MSKKAEKLFTQIWVRTLQRFGQISTFRNATKQGMLQTISETVKESIKLGNSLVRDAEYKDFNLYMRDIFKTSGGIKGFAKQISQDKLTSYKTFIDVSSIIIAHSIIDAAAIDYCRVIEILAPSDWETSVIKRKVSLEEIKKHTYKDILKGKVNEYVNGLDRESLLKKIDTLFLLCRPPEGFAPLKDYKFDRERIENLDDMRHKIIHGSGITAPLKTCDKEIFYMHKSCYFLKCLVEHKYKLKINTTYFQDCYKTK